MTTTTFGASFELAKLEAQEQIDEARAMLWKNSLPHPAAAAAAAAHGEWAHRKRGAGGIHGTGGGGRGGLMGTPQLQASRLQRGRPKSAPVRADSGRLSGAVRVVPLPTQRRAPPAAETPPAPTPPPRRGRLMKGAPSAPRGALEREAMTAGTRAEGAGAGAGAAQDGVGFTTGRRSGDTVPVAF
jgi:hypothetical protein